SETDADLSKVVIAAFAAAVQEQNDRPAAQLRIVRRKPDSISIGVIAERDPALEEMRAAAAGEEKYCGESGGYSNRSYSAARTGTVSHTSRRITRMPDNTGPTFISRWKKLRIGPRLRTPMFMSHSSRRTGTRSEAMWSSVRLNMSPSTKKRISCCA